MARRNQRGVYLITFAIWAVLLLGAGGAALDGGRLFVNRNEAQGFADAAALAAAQRLDGTAEGIRAARRAAKTASANLWDFSTRPIENPALEFASAAAPENWISEPASPAGYTRVRVTAEATQQLFFAPLFLVRNLQLVRVRAVAEQAPTNEFKQGLWPFTVTGLGRAPAPHFGLRPGEQYTLRSGEGAWWGRNNSSILAERIVAGAQDPSEQITAGKPFPEVSEPSEEAAEFIGQRRMQDTDSQSANYSAYVAAGSGNGRRLVVLPIRDADRNAVRGFGMFFLLEDAWRVEYTGKAFVPNAGHPGAGTPGIYAIRLVRGS